MSDKKAGATPELSVKKPSEAKKASSVSRFFFVAIIVFLAFLMVGGTFFYIFSPGFSGKDNAFGFYNKKPIVLENGNVFGRTLMADPAYAEAVQDGSNNYTQMYQSFYNAYQSQVVFDAVNEDAKAAKIPAPAAMVNKIILSSGAYNDDDGNFSLDRYNKILPAERQSFYQYVKSITPYENVLKDYGSILTASEEIEFVKELNRNTRDFEYFNVGYGVFPDESAKVFIEENSYLFDKMNLSIISCTTEERAKEAYEALKTKSWNDVVSEYSEDSYKENNGEFGSDLYANAIASNITSDADLAKIRALTPDTYTEPIQGPYSWAIYKLNKPVEEADPNDKDVLYYAKSLIFTKNKDDVMPYIEVAKTSITSLLEEHPETDFHSLEDEYGVVVNSVVGSVYNASGSQFIADIAYVDLQGQMASAVKKDVELYKKVFAMKVGEYIGPVELDDGTVIFIRSIEADENVNLSSTMSGLYEEYGSEIPSYDIKSSILKSPKHEDHFTEKFIEVFLSNNNSSSASAGNGDSSSRSAN